MPLGSAVNPTVRPSLATNAQNMQQVTFHDRRLWSTVATVLNSPEDTEPAGAFGDPNKAGAAWFAVKVDNDNKLKAKVDDQGYIAIKNANLLFPAIGINQRGQAAIAFSISGPDYFPSAGYVQSSEDEGFGKIHIAAAGVNSEDGFTAYPSQNANFVCDSATNPTECEARWGDYGAGAVDRDGNIWLASEYIGPRARTVRTDRRQRPLGGRGRSAAPASPRGVHRDPLRDAFSAVASAASPLTRSFHFSSWPLRAPFGVSFSPSGESASVNGLPSMLISRRRMPSSLVMGSPWDGRYTR